MIDLKVVSLITTCTVFVAFIAVVLQAVFEAQHLNKLTTIVTSLVHLEHDAYQDDKPRRIAIGYGSCSDLYVNAPGFLNYSNVDLRSDPQFLLDDITSENELLLSFGYYFKNGAAAE